MTVRVIFCERCHLPADVDWLECTQYDDPEPMYTPGLITCSSPGCVGADGTQATNEAKE